VHISVVPGNSIAVDREMPQPNKNNADCAGTVQFWREFRREATRPCLGGLLTALFVAASLFASCFVLVTPDLMATDKYRYFARSRSDEGNFITAKAQRLARWKPLEPAVFILGTSSDQEAITSYDQLAQFVAERCNITPVVHDLTMGGQSHWEMAALTDMLPSSFDGVVVLGLGVLPPRFLLPRERLESLLKAPRLGFVSETFDSEARLAGLRIPRRTGNYFWDNRRFFGLRIPHFFWHLVTGPVDYVGHGEYYELHMKFFGAASEIARMKVQLTDYDKKAPQGLAVFARIAEKIKNRGRVSVVIVQSPANPEFIARAWGNDFYKKHQQYMREYSAEHGMLYWDLGEAAGLKNEDFYDWVHIRELDARVRYTTLLGEELANLLRVTLEKENRQ